MHKMKHKMENVRKRYFGSQIKNVDSIEVEQNFGSQINHSLILMHEDVGILGLFSFFFFIYFK